MAGEPEDEVNQPGRTVCRQKQYCYEAGENYALRLYMSRTIIRPQEGVKTAMNFIGIDSHRSASQVCTPTEDGEFVGRRIKTDGRDARALCEACRLGARRLGRGGRPSPNEIYLLKNREARYQSFRLSRPRRPGGSCGVGGSGGLISLS